MSKIITDTALESAIRTLVDNLPKQQEREDCRVIEIQGIHESTDPVYDGYYWNPDNASTNYSSRHDGCHVAFIRDKGGMYLINTSQKKINRLFADAQDFAEREGCVYVTREGHGIIVYSSNTGCYLIMGNHARMGHTPDSGITGALLIPVGDSGGTNPTEVISLDQLQRWLMAADVPGLPDDVADDVADASLGLMFRDPSGQYRALNLAQLERYLDRKELTVEVTPQDIVKCAFGLTTRPGYQTFLEFYKGGADGKTLTVTQSGSIQARLHKINGYYGLGIVIETPYEFDEWGDNMKNSAFLRRYVVWNCASADRPNPQRAVDASGAAVGPLVKMT